MKAPTIPRRIWLIATTVAIIGGLFAYYFFVYMEARRVELEAKKFRALAQYAENIRGAYGERTKKLFSNERKIECAEATKDTSTCVADKKLKAARLDVIKPIIAQSDFSELAFEVDRNVEKQTFRNTIDGNIVSKILNTDNADIKRQVAFTINDKDYVVFIHTFELANKRWKILGFCVRDEFESQVRAVGLKYVVVASLCLIIILLLMPLLKLLIMNDSEKLHMTNVWFCGFSLVVGTSFLLLIMFMASDFSAINGSQNGSSNGLTREGRIKKLSADVEGKFIEELKSIRRQIKEARQNLDSVGADSCSFISKNTLHYTKILKTGPDKFPIYPFFNELLWIRDDGFQDTVVATHKVECIDLVSLSNRKYFSQARTQDSSLAMPDSEVDDDRFALQSIHSYISNNHEAGLGVLRDKNNPARGVLAIATKLHTVMDPLLPPGYQFIFIDSRGKVWFHSKTEKNLNENFIDETGQNIALTASVNSGSDAMVTLNYDRSNHRAFVHPIRNTGLTLVVLHDDDYFNVPIVLTVGFAFILLSLLFFIQGLHQLILLATTYRFSLLKVKRFFLEWLKPDKEKRRIYRRAVWIQMFLMIPIGGIAAFTNSLDLVTFFLVLPIYLTVYHYFSLEYRRLIEEKEKTRIWLHPFFVSSFLLVLILNFAGIYLFNVENLWVLLIPQFFVILVLVFFFSWIVLQKLTSRILSQMAFATNSLLAMSTRLFLQMRLQRLASYDKSYCNFLFLWLILTSVVPTYYFYKVSYYEEGKIWLRYLLHATAHSEESRDVELNKELKAAFQDKVKKISNEGRYLTVTDEIDTTKLVSKDPCPATRKPIHEFVFNDIPPLSGIAEETRAAIFPLPGDSTWLSSDNILSSEMNYRTSQLEQRTYNMTLPKYRVLKGAFWPFFLVGIILGYVILYRTLRFCITHIFGVGLLEHNRYKTPKLLEVERLRYFIVGLPHSGKKKLIKRIRERRKIDEGNITTIDLNGESSVAINPGRDLIVVTGFHHELTNHKKNQRKLERLSKLLKYPNTPVIIISNTDPSTILDFYDKQADYYRSEKADSELEGKYRECKQAHLNWSQMLNSFSVHYQKLRECRPSQNINIDSELGHGDFLPRLHHQLSGPLHSLRDREKMVLQVEDLSQTYYQAIWNCLSTSEKFLLHDLAKDNFVNMRNMKVIRALRQKGLMVGRNSLQIMNKSFNNFILSVVEEDADVKMEQQIRQKGSWNTVHLILVITIISIIVFLGVAQQELFKNFQAILVATTTLLPLLARFGGIFSGSKVKE